MIINPYIFGSPDDVVAFMTATGIPNDGTVYYASTAYEITGAELWTAITTLVTDLKSAGIWAKKSVIYPFIGGSASTHKWNLKDPRDLDAAFRGSFTGGWTHGATGVTPNGTNAYLRTFHAANLLDKLNSGYSFYSRTNDSGLYSDFGTLNSTTVTEVLTNFGGEVYNDVPEVGDRIQLADGSSTAAFYSGNLTASNVKVYRNGSVFFSKGSAASNDYTSDELMFSTGADTRYSPRELAFATISNQGLTDAEASDEYDIVQAFQTALFREV